MLLSRIKRKLLHLRLQPIEVFVFHQVSDIFDSSTMWECDWTETEQFKGKILNFKNKYNFIPLAEAHYHLKSDVFRFKKYAVLTCDDGWSSIKRIIPWLAEQKIHVTLFLNPAYLSGEQIRENDMRGLLCVQDVEQMLDDNRPYISVGSHGWNHNSCVKQDMDSFAQSVTNCDNFLAQFGSSYIKFFAYPCGQHTAEQDQYLRSKGIMPVYCDWMKNINKSNCIHRTCIDNSYKYPTNLQRSL